MRIAAIFLLLSLTVFSVSAQSDGDTVVINGKVLDASEMEIVHRLERQYAAEAVPGRYWYDRLSGLYGAEGSGAFGQIFPNLPIGGELKPDASNGNTGVWVNGRQLHATDVAYVQQCTPVEPGRYWLDAHGNGGYEGGPVEWNLAHLCANARQRAGASFRGRFGSVLSDGTTSGAFFRTPDGGVAGVTCGPDGGCIY